MYLCIACDQYMRRYNGEAAKDPLTGEPVQPVSDMVKEVCLGHFSSSELGAAVERASSGARWLRRVISAPDEHAGM